MPKTLATAVWPRDALQIVARNRPMDVAVRMIGSAAPMALTGTTPISARPRDTDPAMKQGSPSADGSPSNGGAVAAAGAASVAGCSCAAGSRWVGTWPEAVASALIASLLWNGESRSSGLNASVRRATRPRVLTLSHCRYWGNGGTG